MQYIAAAENDLRFLVEEVMFNEFGADWLTHSGLAEKQIANATRSQDAELRRRFGAGRPSLLHFTQFWDLETIISKNWALFAEALGEMAVFKVYMEKLGAFRNPPAHSRELLPFEEALVQGMTGEIRNRVTSYRSTMSPDDSYYPRIESVRDSFGQEFLPGGLATNFSKVVALQVGDQVEFLCRAWNPEGGELDWRLERESDGRKLLDKGTGTQVRLVLKVTDELVSYRLGIAIILTSRRKYHRVQGSWDDSVSFVYSVVPPEVPPRQRKLRRLHFLRLFGRAT